MYDVAVIGGGIIGAFCLRTLSACDIKICLIEKETDCSMGTTKANSAIVHGGFDPEPGTLMAKTNVEGNMMYKRVSEELSVPFMENGAFVVAFNEEEIKELEELLERGIENGVKDLRIISGDEARKISPRLTDEVVAALYCPHSGVTSPFEMASALIENAMENGADVFYDHRVCGIEKNNGKFIISSFNDVKNNMNEKIEAKYIINAAGVNADDVFELIGKKEFTIKGYRGQYFITDRSENHDINVTLFRTPDENGKGVLVAPMVHGNLILGPDSLYTENKEYKGSTRDESAFIREKVLRFVPDLNLRSSIRSFVGVRAYSDRNDFIIEESESVKGMINLAGIKSPGLTAAPAIALMAKELLEKAGLELKEKSDFNPYRKPIGFIHLPEDERRKLIEKDPSYGRIICRCESVTEGEIREALSRPNAPRTVEGVKRRVRPGSGRCQGGFCLPRVVEILSDHYGCDEKEILMDGAGSFIITEDMEDRDGKN